jgi:hypothetical protein
MRGVRPLVCSFLGITGYFNMRHETFTVAEHVD